MKLLNADELVAAVFSKAGAKVETDDPMIHDMLLQQAILAAVFDNLQEQQQAQVQQHTKDIQAAIEQASKPVIVAAEELRQHKQQLLAEVLHKNAEAKAQTEANIYGSIAKRVQQQTEQHLNHFSGSLKILLLSFIVVQSLVLAIVLIVNK